VGGRCAGARPAVARDAAIIEIVLTVGICEDDHALRQILRTALERADCAVRVTASGAEAVRAFGERPPDVLVLDIGLPDADGRDVCQALRARGVETPVIFLTARDALSDRLSGFHAGGDDYLTKPFAASELAVRVKALARRGTNPSVAPAADLGTLLDPTRHAISADAPVALTPTEYRLLAAVCAARGSVVRRGELIAAAWPDGAIVSGSTLDAYVSRIRAKLRRAQRTEELVNVRGVGYRLG
jgi:two-component system response regulator MprA